MSHRYQRRASALVAALVTALVAGGLAAPASAADEQPGEAPGIGLTYAPDLVSPGDQVTATVQLDDDVTGAVDFTLDGSAIETAELAAGHAAVVFAAPPEGDYDLMAVYDGPSEPWDETVTLSVGPARALAGELTLEPPVLTVGEDVTATVSLDRDVAGTVVFHLDGEFYGESELSDGRATHAFTGLAAGAYTVTAERVGDEFFQPWESTAVDLEVRKRVVEGAVEVSSASPALGDDVEVIVRTPAARSGSVLLYVDEAPTPEEQVVDGITRFTLAGLALGTHEVRARYDGDAMHDEWESELTMITVGKRPTTPALSLSSATITLGQDVTVTATVTAGATGTVEYLDGATSLGTATITDDKAALTFTPKAPGARTITATYSGDASHEGRPSDGVTLIVEPPVVAPPVTPPVVNPPVETPPVVAPPVVVPPVVAPPVVTPPAKAKVSLSTPAFSKSTQIYGHKKVAKVTTTVRGAASGTVVFYRGSTKLGTAKIARGRATIALPKKLKPGTYRGVVAKYSGTRTTTAATSPKAKTFTVAKTKLAKKAKVTGKTFKKNAKPKITLTLGKLTNGTYATGKVKIYVGKKVIKTIKLTTKHKGKITLTLPKRYRTTIKVKAALVSTKTTAGATSKIKVLRVR
ncbi:Ig-like domain (group 3) [Flavimobilis marinus]|uniref:Ig-like domain (Group 3) n=1 Tax=Flavimobilis marinus TaxID=285351 RepID=A0A1I2CD39_9MICO|nr:Ig-like domain-containing protein [Flavimobilis marinus]SFE66174.1 Ig-like domain (group 3) [Flavimobilis marinus]